MIVQTAGRDSLGDFAPEFAHFNDDVLFGENWNNEDIDVKTRCIITVSALMTLGVGESLKYHLENAKKNGVTKKEIASIITHLAFYSGWPRAWTAFNLATEVWREDEEFKENLTDLQRHENKMLFPVGEPNYAYADYFTGKSYLAPVSTEQIGIYNVTFEPSCRNNWHIHNAKEGGGQILICTQGEGYYQEWGREKRHLKAGDVVNIKPGVKHWHGATEDGYFSHLAIEVPGVETSTEWLEEVSDENYRG